MKPAPFEYLDPPDLAGVLAALREHGDDAALLAGGQSLVPLLNLRLARPLVVVDLRNVAGLDRLEVGPDAVTVGARVTASQLLGSPAATAAVPGLAEALRCVGHGTIRNRTTVAGSIAHADPAAELPAVLLGVGGEVELASTAGRRTVAAAELYDGPFSTTRRPDEVVVSVRFPVPPGRSGWAEICRRAGDFALAGVFCSVDLADDGTVGHVAVSVSGVAGTPVRSRAVPDVLVGAPLDAERVAAAGRALRSELDPPDDVHATAAHRRALAGVLVERLLARLGDLPTTEAAS